MNRIFKFFVVLSVAVLSLAACKEKEKEEVVEPVKYTVSADSDFNADLKANIKVTASRAADEDVSVLISRDEASTLPEANVSFPAKIDIKAGEKEASAEVAVLNPIALEPGEYKIVLSAAIGDEALADKLTINYGRPDLSGAWSIIGLIDWNTDIAMEEVEDGWYAAYEVEVEANTEFKFRKDASWDLAYGLDATAAVPVDGTEFDVNTKGGENTNLKIEAAGLYDIYLNPNKAKAKVELLTSEKVLKVTKLWEKLSTSSANWMADFGGTAGTDFNIAIDDENVYVAEFGGSKKIWAIDIAESTSDLLKATAVDNSEILSEGFDGSIFLSCARVIKKNDGTPVLLVSNLSNGNQGRLYAYENGINAKPRVITLDQYGAGRRLGDSFSVYGTYEKAMLIFATHSSDSGVPGFVTFQLPPNASNVSGLWNRYNIALSSAFEGYWPFPGDLSRGMFGKRIAGGDGYRSQFMSIAVNPAEGKTAEETLWETSSAKFDATCTGLNWLAGGQNLSGFAYNYIEFNGKRYVIWASNTVSTGAKATLMIKEAELSKDWKDILNTDGLFFSAVLEGTVATGWKGGVDVAVYNTGNEVYIAINKATTGIAVYKMSLEFVLPEK